MNQGQNPILALVRHGQSVWNKENKFTGWSDVDLSPEGIRECLVASERLQGIFFHIAYTSELKRAWRSLEIITDELQYRIPTIRSSALNERHYGQLCGVNKEDAARIYGEEQVIKWRRGFRDRPPDGESLEDTARRVILFFQCIIAKDLGSDKNVLVVAHGNSLRALAMYIENLGENDVTKLEIPTGECLFYEIDKSLPVAQLRISRNPSKLLA